MGERPTLPNAGDRAIRRLSQALDGK